MREVIQMRSSVSQSSRKHLQESDERPRSHVAQRAISQMSPANSTPSSEIALPSRKHSSAGHAEFTQALSGGLPFVPFSLNRLTAAMTMLNPS